MARTPWAVRDRGDGYGGGAAVETSGSRNRRPDPDGQTSDGDGSEVEALDVGAPEIDAPGVNAPRADPLDELWRSPVDDSFDAAAFLDDSLDDLQALGDRIMTLAAHIAAAEHDLLVLIAEFDARRGWAPGGYRGCAEWLMHRTGMCAGTARERVRVARTLVELPETSAAMSRGELSFSKVRAVTRAATPENETELLELARAGSAVQVERMVRAWKKLSRKDEAEVERARHLSRTFSIFPDEDGMYVVRGRLDPEVGAALMRAVEAASDALYAREVRETREPWESRESSESEEAREPEEGRESRESWGASGGSRATSVGPSRPFRATSGATCCAPSRSTSGITPEQRRADAIGLLAVRGLEAGFGGDSRMSGSRAERYQVMLHVEAATLSATEEPGRSELPDGTRVPAGTSRRLSCDAAVVEVKHAPGQPTTVLDVGRRTRTIPPALRRALEVRDRGCRFPGCDRIRFTEGHHIVHWADGGETNLDNLVLLCLHHHRLVHEDGFRVELMPTDEGLRVNAYDPRGVPLPDAPHPPALAPLGPDAVQNLLRGNERRGVRPQPLTGTARHRRDDDIPLPVLSKALEALEATAPAAPAAVSPPAPRPPR